jgi:hypothetical protein
VIWCLSSSITNLHHLESLGSLVWACFGSQSTLFYGIGLGNETTSILNVILVQFNSLSTAGTMRVLAGIAAGVWTLCLIPETAGFVPKLRTQKYFSLTKLEVGVSPNLSGEVDSRSFVLSREEVKPLFSLGEGDKEKLVNGFGLWTLFVSILTGPIWMLAMKLVHRMEDDENRQLYDMTGKIWSKTWLTLTNSYPTITGDLERLKAGNDNGACLFVANHASWLDIPVLCTVLDPCFKFIAKGELSNVPCIGTQLSGVSGDDLQKNDLPIRA